MVGTNAYIKGTGIELGINGVGGFEGADMTVSPPPAGMHPNTETNYFGFVANPQANGWATFDGDFFTPGAPENGWGITIGDNSLIASNNCNDNSGIDGSILAEIPGQITNYSHNSDCYNVDWDGDLTLGTNLHFHINYFLQETALYYTTTVSITNNTSASIPTLYYYRNVDPDNNVILSGDYITQNTIVFQPGTSGCAIAHVSATQSTPWDSYLGLAAAGSEWRATYGGFSNRSGYELWNGITGGSAPTPIVQTDGSTNFADEAIALSYRIQNLAPGATVTFKFVVILSGASANNAIDNLMYLSYPGSTGVPPSACNSYTDTLHSCGAPIPISVDGQANSAYTWTWSPTTGLSSSTGANITANPSTTTEYTVTGTPTSTCYNPITFVFIVDVNPCNIFVTTNNPTVCAGACATLTATVTSGTAPFTYSWSTGETTASITVCPTLTTTYTVTVEDSINLTATSLATVSINSNSVITPTATPAAICIGDVSSLSATSSVVGTSYTWMPGSLTGTPVTVTPTATTIYTVSGTAAGCSGSATVSLTVNPIPIVTSLATPASICNGSSSQLSANSSVVATTFVWAPGALTGSPITVSPLATTTYTVLGTASGCTASSSVTLTVKPNPVITSTATPLAVCNGVPSSLDASSSQPGTTFLWMPGSLAGSPTTVTPAVTTTYSVIGTSNGCTGSSFVTINVSNNPVISISAVPGHICPGDTSTLNCIGAAQTYSWSPTIAISNFTGPTTNAYPSSTTTYTVTASNNGCMSTADYTLVVSPLPSVDFTSDIREGCQGLTIHFQDLTTPAISQWNWNFGDTHISYGNTSSLQNPYHYYGGAGTYDVSLSVVTMDGCSMAISYPGYIITHPIPSAEFAVNPDIINELDPLVFFIDQSVGPTIWNWYFGELNVIGNISNLQNPTHVYSDTGMFYPTLVVFTDYGCSDTAVRSVYVEPNFAFYIPNAFTPNDDGKNQSFIPKGEGINKQTFRMRIYDRWGRQICYTEDMENGWDGKIAGGKVAIEGVYTWYITFYDINRKYHSYKGSVLLIK